MTIATFEDTSAVGQTASQAPPEEIPLDQLADRLCSRFEYLREKIRPRPEPRIALVFGAGINYSLLDDTKPFVAEMLTWTGLLRHIAWYPLTPPPRDEVTGFLQQDGAAWDRVLLPTLDREASVKLKRRVKLMEAILADNPEPEHFAAIAHLLKHEMQKEWQDAVRHVMAKIEDKAIQKDSPWWDLLREIGTLTQEGRVKLLTTNFDSLLAQAAAVGVLLPTGPASSSDPSIPDIPLDLRSRREDGTFQQSNTCLHTHRLAHWLPSAWESWRAAEGPLHTKAVSQVASVLHLHGWGGEPNRLILGIEDYHDARIQASHGVPPNDIVGRLLQPDCITIFLGVGAGMLDKHIKEIWSSALPEDEEAPLSENFWLLNEDFDKNTWQAWKKLPYSGRSTAVWHGRDSLVKDVPGLLRGVLDRIFPH